MPERTSISSNSGQARRNSWYSSSVQKPMTWLHAGAVVPASIEQDDFALGRQLSDIPLEIPLPALAFRRRPERNDAADARIEGLGYALDRAALAGGIPALEQHDDLEAVQPHPLLQLDELKLQMGKFLDVLVVLGRLVFLGPFGQGPILLDCCRFLDVAQHRQFGLTGFVLLGHLRLFSLTQAVQLEGSQQPPPSLRRMSGSG